LTTKEFEQVGWPKGVWRNGAPAFVDTAHAEGIYGGTSNPYTHRRLVDRWHNGLPKGTEKILLNWPTHTDCAGFPFRGLVPARMDGLLGAGKNIGYSSIVSSALRLHGQMMHVGQAAGAAAVIALRDGIEAREIARDFKRVRELQLALVAPRREGCGVLLWPYFDLKVDDRHFEAANMLAVRQILPGEPGARDFNAWQPVTRREMARAVARAVVSVKFDRNYQFSNPSFADVPATDPDFPYIESLSRWGALDAGGSFNPDRTANWVELHGLLDKLGLKPSPGLLVGTGRAQGAKLPLARHELANHLWAAIKSLPERFPDATDYLQPGHDADGDGLADLDDPLPFDRDNNNLPDLIDPKTKAASP
jgi:hypothetical protein